ncbi:hypothetical protein [Saccharopolyspora sp. ASAGF58]|uniref:hypothetical protein n=1 Tax=Saccharopolyspora sp. ASAGF58 TaxID=2719023 RepID=UPI00143FEA97|nr:hypothetical protein [Saccharopolyspora sp. ASAGF58]QIZ38682.1 hypothetical protein FDZ84_34425 [Saccharopolyspora sp. ASAGF58]
MNGSPRDNLRWLVQALRRWVDRVVATIIAVLLGVALLGIAMQIMLGAITAAAFVRIAWQVLCLALIVGTRVVPDSLAEQAWHREWDVVEPKWIRLRRGRSARWEQ